MSDFKEDYKHKALRQTDWEPTIFNCVFVTAGYALSFAIVFTIFM